MAVSELAPPLRQIDASAPEEHRGWSVEALDDRALDELRGEWEELLAASPSASVFLTWEWLSTWWRPARRFIDGGMTSGIGDPDVLARTITVYTDVTAFQRALEIPGSDDVHALVVDRSGAVLARGRGEPDDASWADVAAGLLTD